MANDGNGDSDDNGDGDGSGDGNGDSDGDGDNSDNLMELQTNIEALHLPNKMNIREYIDYPEERNIEEPLTDQKLIDLIVYQENEGEEETDSEE